MTWDDPWPKASERQHRQLVVKTVSCFPRDLIVQEGSYCLLGDAGSRWLQPSRQVFRRHPDRPVFRQILGSVSQFEKAI
jgi:hypothetical protein